MQTNLGHAAGVWNSEQGAFISTQHQHFAEILSDYNPNLSLVWIPAKDRGVEDSKPFAILDSSPNKPPYIVRYLTEEEMRNPAAILAWIFDGDLARNRPVDVLRRIENREAADQLMLLKEREEELENVLDFGAFVARTPLHTFKHNGRVFRE